MKSIVLIIWLVAADGHQEVALTRHYDDWHTCEARAEVIAQEYAGKGKLTRHLCHEVIEEVGDVDENGNPVPRH